MIEEADKRDDPPRVARFAKGAVQYQVPGMEHVRVHRDLSARTIGDASLLFDIYEAAIHNETGSAPVVVFIHGGPISGDWATTPKQWRAFQSIGQLIAASGMNAVMFDHRFRHRDEPHDAIEDINSVLVHLSSNTDALGIDAKRICLWAFSRGGIFLARYIKSPPEWLKCIVAFYPALDADMPEISPAWQIETDAEWMPPTLIAAAGREDVPGFKEGMSRFVQAAIAKGVPLDLLIHATGSHGFDILDGDARTREILRKTIEFIRSHLGVASS